MTVMRGFHYYIESTTYLYWTAVLSIASAMDKVQV